MGVAGQKKSRMSGGTERGGAWAKGFGGGGRRGERAKGNLVCFGLSEEIEN